MGHVIAKQREGRSAIDPDHARFAHYLYCLQSVNGTLQPGLGRNMILARSGATTDGSIMSAMTGRQYRRLAAIDAGLAVVRHMAGVSLTAADIMIVFD